MWSRRTGRSCASSSATTATTPTPNSLPLNKIWVLQSKLTNYFYPQQKLVSQGPRRRESDQEVRHRHHSASARSRPQDLTEDVKKALASTYAGINPAAVQRQIQALTTELLTITTSKAGPRPKAQPLAGIRR